MNISFRKLEAKDSKLYREIRLEALREYPEYFGSSYEEQCALEKLYFERLLEEKYQNAFMFGAFYDDKLIGICGLTTDRVSIPNSGEIIQMYVKRGFQGKKIGYQLLDEIIKFTKKQNKLSSIILGVKKSNTIAHYLYSNMGFSSDDMNQDDEDVVYMKYTL